MGASGRPRPQDRPGDTGSRVRAEDRKGTALRRPRRQARAEPQSRSQAQFRGQARPGAPTITPEEPEMNAGSPHWHDRIGMPRFSTGNVSQRYTDLCQSRHKTHTRQVTIGRGGSQMAVCARDGPAFAQRPNVAGPGVRSTEAIRFRSIARAHASSKIGQRASRSRWRAKRMLAGLLAIALTGWRPGIGSGADGGGSRSAIGHPSSRGSRSCNSSRAIALARRTIVRATPAVWSTTIPSSASGGAIRSNASPLRSWTRMDGKLPW